MFCCMIQKQQKIQIYDKLYSNIIITYAINNTKMLLKKDLLNHAIKLIDTSNFIPLLIINSKSLIKIRKQCIFIKF